MPQSFEGKEMPFSSKICKVSGGYYNILMFLLVALIKYL